MSAPLILMFPGQGSQYAQMGRKLKDQTLLKKADDLLPFSLFQLCTEDDSPQLNLTAYTQPALLTHSISLWYELKNWLQAHQREVSTVMGHSLGEYSALVAAGVLSFEDAVQVVHKRGLFMQEAVPAGVGQMVAVMRASLEEIELACQSACQGDEWVGAANYNSADQVVIAGHIQACERALIHLKEKTKARTIPLKVSAPFHTTLMKPAAEKMREELSKISFSPLQYAYIPNTTAQLTPPPGQGEHIRNLLVDQMASAVRWYQSLSQLPSDAIYLEVGPGKVLSGLAQKIHPQAKVINMDQENIFEKLEEALL